MFRHPARRARPRLLVCALLTVLATLALGAQAAAAASTDVDVDVRQRIVDTGITLAAGQQAIVTASADYTACESEGGPGNPCFDRAPAGADETCSTYFESGCLAPGLPAWALIGRIDSGRWTYAGEGPTTFIGPGRLTLAYNDDDSQDDNFGEIRAQIEVTAVGPATVTSVTSTPLAVPPLAPVVDLAALTPSSPLVRGADDRLVQSPLRSSPLRSSPLRSSPLRSSPLRSSPLRSSPLRSSPLRSSALGTLSLAQIPLRSSSWQQLLAGTSLDVPPASLTLDQLYALDPLPATIRDLTLADIELESTPLRSSSLGALMFAGTTLADLAPPYEDEGASWCDWWLYGEDPCVLADHTVGELEANERISGEAVGDIPLTGQGVDLRASILGSIRIADLDLDRTPLAGRTDLSAYTTVADLLEAMPLPGLDTLTLSDLLPGVVQRGDVPIDATPLSQVIGGQPRRSTGLIRYEAVIAAPCTVESLQTQLALPAGARYIPGSARATARGVTTVLTDPLDVDAATLAFDLDESWVPACVDAPATPQAVRVQLTVEPPARLGAAPLGVVAFGDGGRSAKVGGTSTMEDLDDPGDTPQSAGRIKANTLVTGYIADARDGDAYVLAAPPVGSEVTVTLDHLPADYDLNVTGPKLGIAAAPLRSSPLRSSPLRSSTIPDELGGDVGKVSPAALQDSPLRSSELESTPLRSSSINRGTTTESVTFTVTPDDAGKSFTIHVSGHNGARSDSPYLLRAQVEPPTSAPACRAPRSLPSAPKGVFPSLPLPSSTRTIFLVNEQRLAQLHPGADIALLRERLDAVASRPEVAGAVVPVESDAAHPTAAAYAAWDANPCSVAAANGVAEQIRAVLGHVSADLDDLRSVVLIGDDETIPQVRVADLVGIANEREEADSLVFGGRDSSASRALRDGFLLTDDAYGDVDPEQGLAGATFVPDVALGRLVETPAQIRSQLDLYVSSQGRLAASTAYVSGYDFLKDGAEAIGDELSILPGIQESRAIDEEWTAADAANALNRSAPGLTSVNAHYDHYRALPAAAFNGLVPDLLRSTQVAPAPGSTLFTAGCHAGLSVSDVGAPDAAAADAERLLDWPARVSSEAVYVANTTFGYGDTETVAYSERLLQLLAAGLASREMTAGQALAIAKQRYAAELIAPGVYDQKASMGLTFYGLPFFKVGAGVEAPALLPEGGTGSTDVRTSPFSVSPQFEQIDTERGSYFTADGEAPQVTHQRPVQPRKTLDVTAGDGYPVHGALLQGLRAERGPYRFRPLISTPTIDLAENEPLTGLDQDVFPTTLARTTRAATQDGERDLLVLAAGQLDANQQFLPPQTLFTRLSGSVLRSRSSDYDPPTISKVRATFDEANVLTISVTTSSNDVVRGVVLLEPPYGDGDWVPVELTGSGGTTWTASLPMPFQNGIPQAVVQLVDAAGNVGVSTNKGPGYRPRPADPEQAPSISATSPVPASGWARGPVTLAIDPGASRTTTFTYSVDGGAPVPYSDPFEVTGDGVHVVRFNGSDGSEGSTVVRIDTTAPTVIGTADVQPSPEGFVQGPLTVSWTCDDPLSGATSCPDAVTIANETEGATVTADEVSDRAGNSITATAGPYSVDIHPPTGTVDSQSSGSITPTLPSLQQQVSGTATDTLAGVREVAVRYVPQVAGAEATTVSAAVTCAGPDRRSCTWSAATPTAAGTYVATATITDRAGRPTTIDAPSPITVGAGTGGGGGGDDSGGGDDGPPSQGCALVRRSADFEVSVTKIVRIDRRPTVITVSTTMTVVVVVPKCARSASLAERVKATLRAVRETVAAEADAIRDARRRIDAALASAGADVPGTRLLLDRGRLVRG